MSAVKSAMSSVCAARMRTNGVWAMVVPAPLRVNSSPSSAPFCRPDKICTRDIPCSTVPMAVASRVCCAAGICPSRHRLRACSAVSSENSVPSVLTMPSSSIRKTSFSARTDRAAACAISCMRSWYTCPAADTASGGISTTAPLSSACSMAVPSILRTTPAYAMSMPPITPIGCANTKLPEPMCRRGVRCGECANPSDKAACTSN